MSDPERQHITPRFLLARFKVEGSPLFVIGEDGEVRERNEKKAITKEGHYNLKFEGSDTYAVEKALGPTESKMGQALSKFDTATEAGEKFDFSPDRDVILDFVILAGVRSVEFNADPSEPELEEALNKAQKSAEQKFGVEVVGRAVKKMNKAHVFNDSRKRAVLMPVPKVEEVIKGLNLSSAIVEGDCEFITGSCPVSLEASVNVNSVNKRRLVLPIGRKTALVASDEPAGVEYAMQCGDVDAVNRQIAQKSKIIAGSSRELIEMYSEDRATDLR